MSITCPKFRSNLFLLQTDENYQKAQSKIIELKTRPDIDSLCEAILDMDGVDWVEVNNKLDYVQIGFDWGSRKHDLHFVFYVLDKLCEMDVDRKDDIARWVAYVWPLRESDKKEIDEFKDEAALYRDRYECWTKVRRRYTDRKRAFLKKSKVYAALMEEFHSNNPEPTKQKYQIHDCDAYNPMGVYVYKSKYLRNRRNET